MPGPPDPAEQRSNEYWLLASQPLQAYMLRNLPASSLARLRGACTAVRDLVDRDTGLLWKATANRVVSATELSAARDALEVQSVLRQQAKLAAGVTSGGFSLGLLTVSLQVLIGMAF